MSGDALATFGALAAAQLAIGWYLGFHSAPAYLAAWTFVALAAIPAWRITRRVFPWSGATDAIIRTSLVAFAEIVLAGLILGSAGLIGPLPYLCVFAVLCAASFTLTPPHQPARISASDVPLAIVAVAIPLLMFIVAVGVVESPLTLYDSLSYHLVFPARWLQEHRLAIIPTPFSDPAQAYQPGNGELFFLWLMLPVHSDLLARVGQLPFLALAAVALYATARRCGARPEHAAYAPLFFLLARPVVEQAAGADVDLICAATFVTSLYLGIVAADSDAPRDWALWGVSLGLYLGTKYLALVYLPVLLALPLIRGVRMKALWAVPGILALGFPWYARNWVVAGSPIYPSSLTVLGLTIGRGAFARAAMTNSVFHVTSLRLLPPILAHAFGAAAFVVWLPCACAAAALIVTRRRWWPAGYVQLVPLVIVALFWFEIPDNADSRFLLPAVAIAMVPLALTFGPGANRHRWLHALYLAGAVWMIAGAQRQIPMTLPWFMGDWLALDGLIARPWLPWFAAASVVSAVVVYVLSRRAAHAVPLLAAAVGAGCIALTIGAQTSYATDRSGPLTLSPTFIRAGTLQGFQWVHEHLAHATVAYAGNNVPYPLFNADLSNRVTYVNIDRHADWLFHDYARARRRDTGDAAVALARPSGQLLPAVGGDASHPRFERREGFRDAWVQNLRAAGVDDLFVSALSAYEIDYVWHDADGFPIESAWARMDGRSFPLLYENSQVRIYGCAH